MSGTGSARGLPDRYTAIESIGAGGMGTVYRAEDALLAKTVCIKVLRSALDASSLTRFQREAQAASKLNHPNLVTVLDFGADSHGQPYLVMDYVRGHTLSEILAEEGALSMERAIKIIVDVLDGLAHAHSKGVLHRDIKPSNIILESSTTDGERAKLLDFGLAKFAVDQAFDEQSLTSTGVVLGTPYYINPEQATGSEVDVRSDIYSLGCVLFECLTGRRPFTGETAATTILKHLNDPIPSLSDNADGKHFPERLERIVQSTLAKRQEDRYPDAQTLAQDLLFLLSDPEVERDRESHQPAIGIAQELQYIEEERSKGRNATKLIAIGAGALFFIAALVLVYFTTTTLEDEKPLAKLKPNSKVASDFLLPTEVMKYSRVKTVFDARWRSPTDDQLADAELLASLKQLEPIEFLRLSRQLVTTAGIKEVVARYPHLKGLILESVNLKRPAVEAIATLRDLEVLQVINGSFHDNDLEPLASIHSLKSINLQNQDITDKTIETIASLPNLKVVQIGENQAMEGEHFSLLSRLDLLILDLWDSKVDTKDLGKLLAKSGKNLAGLKLSGLKITDETLKQLPPTSKLQYADLSYNLLTDESLRHLGKFPQLKKISMSYASHVTDQGLSYLAGLNGLVEIDLKATHVTTLKPLENFKAISLLQLQKCQGITDESLKSLVKRSTLRTLDISNTGITDKGLFYLEQIARSFKGLKFTATTTPRVRMEGLNGVTPEVVDRLRRAGWMIQE